MCFSLVLGLVAVIAQPEVSGPLQGVRCGRVIIEGNTDTPDCVVLELCEIRPGQLIPLGSIGALRDRLRACPAFQTNPWQGVGPEVELIPWDSPYWDLRIRVVDRPGSWLRYSVGFLVRDFVSSVMFCDPNAPRSFQKELEYIWRRAREEGR